MICPGCGGEFVEGIYDCPDCGMPLKHEWQLPQPPRVQPEEALVEVCSISDFAVLPVVKSLLNAAAIPHVWQGEHAGGTLALPPLLGSMGKAAFATRLLVPASRVDEVRELLEELEEEDSGTADTGRVRE